MATLCAIGKPSLALQVDIHVHVLPRCGLQCRRRSRKSPKDFTLPTGSSLSSDLPSLPAGSLTSQQEQPISTLSTSVESLSRPACSSEYPNYGSLITESDMLSFGSDDQLDTIEPYEMATLLNVNEQGHIGADYSAEVCITIYLSCSWLMSPTSCIKLLATGK